MPPARRHTKVAAQYRLVKKVAVAYRRITRGPRLRAIFIGNKWWFLTFLVIIPLFYIATVVIERTHTVYHFFAGAKGDTYTMLAPRLADVLNKPDKLERFLHLNIVPDFSLHDSCGALDNLYYLNRGAAQLAFVEDGLPLHFEKIPHCSLPITQEAWMKKEKTDEIRLRAVMLLYQSPLHVVVRKPARIVDVREIQPHTKVYMGPDGGATAFLAQLILAHYGIVVDRRGLHLDFEEAIEQLRQGEIEIGFFVGGLDSGALHKILESDQFKLVAIADASHLKLLYPYLDVLHIPAQVRSSEEITTVGTKTVLAASTDLSDMEVYQVATKIATNIHDLLQDIPLNAAKSIDQNPQEDLYYPLHEGAVRFYNHNPPFFLDPRTLFGIGTYLSVLLALYKLPAQFIRNYLVHRILHSVDRAAATYNRSLDQSTSKRYQFFIRKLRHKALTLLKQRRITLDDFYRINEYIKGHS
jgi:TRAP transporter TAXI family solute receptor